MKLSAKRCYNLLRLPFLFPKLIGNPQKLSKLTDLYLQFEHRIVDCSCPWK